MLLERLLTHGPISTAKEFEDIIEDVIKNMASFQHIDQKGYLLGMQAYIYSLSLLRFSTIIIYIHYFFHYHNNLFVFPHIYAGSTGAQGSVTYLREY